MKSLQKSFLAVTLLSLIACGTFKNPYYSGSKSEFINQNEPDISDLKYKLYLLGDAGELDDTVNLKNYVLDQVKNELEGKSDRNAVAYLGDNLYPKGLVSEGHPDRERGEDILRAQINVVKNSNAKAYFVPGNHDWKHYKKGGLKFIKRQAKFIKDNSDKKQVKFFPKNGCGDPEVVRVDKELVMIFIDSQWWLTNWEDEKKINKGCEIKSRRAFLDEMEHLFVQYKNKQIVVVMYHTI